MTAAALVAIGCSVSRDQPVPGEQWTHVPAADAGFDDDRLSAFTERIGGDGCLVHNGRMFHTWGAHATRRDIASAMKPFLTHFTLKAVEEGQIESLDDKLTPWVPELRIFNPELDNKDQQITFRHLLSQTSGYALREPPGAAFGYNDFQTGLLLWTLIRRVYASGYPGADQALLHDRLGQWLDFQDQPTMNDPGAMPGRLLISPRDLARFGLLYLRQGQWRGQSVLCRDLVRQALSNPVPYKLPLTTGEPAEQLRRVTSIGSNSVDIEEVHGGWYSFFWLVNRTHSDQGMLFPDAPPGTFAAVGHGGKSALIVIPEADLVVVWTDAFEDEPLIPFATIGRLRINAAVHELLLARLP